MNHLPFQSFTSSNHERNDQVLSPKIPQIQEEMDVEDAIHVSIGLQENEDYLSPDGSFSSIDDIETMSGDVFSDDDDNIKNGECDNTKLDQLKGFLRNWASKNNITLKALSELTSGLRENHSPSLNDLPKDGRTLMKTPTSVDIRPMPPGLLYPYRFNCPININFI